MAQGNEPIVTVVMPTYEHSEYLRLAAFSVLGQTVPVKLIVVPVQSDEPTINLMRKLNHQASINFDPSEIKWIAADRPDVFGQMQLGLEAVDTPYFCVFGSDDFMLPNMIASLLRYADCKPNPIVSPSFALTDEHLTIQSFHYNKPFNLAKQMKGSYIPDISLVKTSEAMKVGGFTKADRDWGYLNHFAFYHRLLKREKCEVVMTRNIGFLYRQLAKSRHSQRYKDKKDIKIHREKMRMIARHYWGE